MNEDIKYWLSQLEINECSAPLFAIAIGQLMDAM